MDINIRNIIVDIVKDHWDKNNKSPIYLAEIGTELAKKSVGNYKDYTSGRGLARYITDVMSDDVEVKKHPFQRSKIVIYPKGEDYTFPDESSSEQPSVAFSPSTTPLSRQNHRLRNTRLNRLISALDGLSDEELREIQIPFHILFKLAK